MSRARNASRLLWLLLLLLGLIEWTTRAFRVETRWRARQPFSSSATATTTELCAQEPQRPLYSISTTTTTTENLRAQKQHRMQRPSLIVFDLDNTLWTPELYQLRQHQRTGQVPVAHRDVKLYDGARRVLDWLEREHKDDVLLAVASRTKSGDWARDLLDQFGLTDRFVDVQIFTGNKKAHLVNIQQNTGVPFHEMLFFDDARDGKYGNCVPVSELGVLCCHCPGGIESTDIFHKALDRYHDWDKTPQTIIEWDGTVSQFNKPNAGERVNGRVKRVFHDKGYGFVEYGDRSTRDLFFHFNDLPATADSVVEVGDEMSFVVGENRGKPQAQDIELSSHPPESTVSLRAFSMNNPFAALLANGYKDLETRNGTMFVSYEPGTKFLLHVGQRIYPDGDRHIEIMKSGGLNDEQIEDLKSMPSGFGKGMAVAIVEVGETFETTVEQRSDPEMQRRIGAYGTDSGMRCTEIRRVEYLQKPVRVKAQGGVFKVNVDRDVIPDGWLD